MATVLIENGAISGALAAILAGRAYTASLPADYATQVTAAKTFATRFLTANAALAVPMADADNANIFLICYAAAYGVLAGRDFTSATAADYATQAAAAAAAAKQGEAELV